MRHVIIKDMCHRQCEGLHPCQVAAPSTINTLVNRISLPGPIIAWPKSRVVTTILALTSPANPVNGEGPERAAGSIEF